MGRFLWILPLCLLLQGQHGLKEVTPPEIGLQDQQVKPTNVLTFTRSEQAQISLDLVQSIGLTQSAGVPGALAVPWTAFYEIGKKDLFPLENILIYQPTLFLQMCLDKYDQEIQGYSVLFCKQERVNNKLLPREKIEVQFRQSPFSVHFNWQEGGGLAKKVLYVEGENKGNMKVLPILGFFVLNKDPDGAEAMKTSRFSIKKFGVHLALKSTLASIQRAQAAGTLNLRYMGQYKVADLGGRVCYKFIRGPYNPPEEDGISEYTFYIDTETWLQVGSELKDVNGELIAEYYFRDLVPNPTFDAKQFTDKGL